MGCPARWPGRDPAPPCAGLGRLEGARRSLRYDVAPGGTTLLRFRLTARRLRTLKRAGRLTLNVVATNTDAAGGTPAGLTVTVERPLPAHRR